MCMKLLHGYAQRSRCIQPPFRVLFLCWLYLVITVFNPPKNKVLWAGHRPRAGKNCLKKKWWMKSKTTPESFTKTNEGWRFTSNRKWKGDLGGNCRTPALHSLMLGTACFMFKPEKNPIWILKTATPFNFLLFLLLGEGMKIPPIVGLPSGIYESPKFGTGASFLFRISWQLSAS